MPKRNPIKVNLEFNAGNANLSTSVLTEVNKNKNNSRYPKGIKYTPIGE
jgi:hypothetical protein